MTPAYPKTERVPFYRQRTVLRLAHQTSVMGANKRLANAANDNVREL
jgi:hypothetical protein